MSNYFNTLTLREKLEQLGKCRFMDASAKIGNILLVSSFLWKFKKYITTNEYL